MVKAKRLIGVARGLFGFDNLINLLLGLTPPKMFYNMEYVALALLFALLVWRGFLIGMRAKDKFGMLLAIGMSAQVGIQVALNIAVVTNLMPNTGISLPFFSFGGSSLVMLLCQMGVMLAISRQSRMQKEELPKVEEEAA